MRSISPFISGLLMVLVLSGSMGFTLTVHNCHHCGIQKLITSFTATGADDMCCCGHDEEIALPGQSTGEYVFSHDCCSLETERMATDQVVRTEVESEILPYFMAASIMAIFPDHNFRTIRLFADNVQLRDGRDLTTLHCQIQS